MTEPSEKPPLLTWATDDEALAVASTSGALDQVAKALRRAYVATADSPKGRLQPSSFVEAELKAEGWVKARVWAKDALTRPTNDSFDGWKVFTDPSGQRFGVGAEVEWNWERVYFDFLKFWRAQAGGQISVGIQILRGPVPLTTR
jgi:hypothetical protein